VSVVPVVCSFVYLVVSFLVFGCKLLQMHDVAKTNFYDNTLSVL